MSLPRSFDRKWKASSDISFIKGTYETKNVEAIQKTIREEDVAYDVSAHVGYFSVLMGDIVGSGGKVIAFEPRGLNLGYLRKHVAVNNCENIEIVSKALGDHSGHAKLETRTGSGTGYVSETGEEDIEIVSIDELVTSGALSAPTFLSIDVEGGEMDVLLGARKFIALSPGAYRNHSSEFEDTLHLLEGAVEVRDEPDAKATQHVVERSVGKLESFCVHLLRVGVG